MGPKDLPDEIEIDRRSATQQIFDAMLSQAREAQEEARKARLRENDAKKRPTKA
jgi:cation transport regulator ChaB